MPIRNIIKTYFTWRILVSLAAIPAAFLLPLIVRYSLQSGNFEADHLLQMWANFDGPRYLQLAQIGQIERWDSLLLTLFPLYPWLIGIFSLIFSPLVSSLLISNICLVISLILLYKLVKMDFDSKVAKMSLLLLLIFPTSFVLGSVYTESLFLLLSIGSIYLMRQNRFMCAGVLVSLAGLTRFLGVALIPVLLIEYIQAVKSNKLKLFGPQFAGVIIAPLGLISYLYFQYVRIGDPLFLLNSYSDFMLSSGFEKFILPHQVFYRYLKMFIFSGNRLDPFYFTVVLELVVVVLSFALSVLALKYTRKSYAVFSLLILFIPMFSGTFHSLPRIVLVAFPIFIMAAKFISRVSLRFQQIIFTFLLLVGFICISLFTRGYFVV